MIIYSTTFKDDEEASLVSVYIEDALDTLGVEYSDTEFGDENGRIVYNIYEADED